MDSMDIKQEAITMNDLELTLRDANDDEAYGEQVLGEHCSSCGREASADRFNQGYSACCNKRISNTSPYREGDWSASDCDAAHCYHHQSYAIGG